MGVGFGFGFGLVYHRKIRPTQLWVELSWVVAINNLKLNMVPKIMRLVQQTWFAGLHLFLTLG